MVMAVTLCSALLTSTISWLLLNQFLAHAAQSDVDCLRSLSDSLEDPQNNVFRTWNFNNRTEGFICNFAGIQCWNETENLVLNIRLSSMGLRGEFPLGISGCSSMTGLDLSGNNLRGNIPNNISDIIGFVTTLDLSSNQFSGEIPADIANCTYLNSLKLDNNQLTGQIPLEIGLLNRLTTFNVTGNRLSGPVPPFINPNSTVDADSYAGNHGLCGDPLPACRSHSRISHILAISIGVVVGVVGLGIVMFLCFRSSKKKENEDRPRVSRKKKEEDPLENKWARNIKNAKHIQVFMFEKSDSKMSLSDLMKATNKFSKEKIIGSERTGTMYSAVLQDGSSVIVKRLQGTQPSEKEFKSEMTTLGNLRHPNLVPLLGYCITKRERLLVYKFMPNGTLHDKIHNINEGANLLEWLLRLKIAIRVAKGLAWLHHSCSPRIIHGNISSKCVLLDEDYEPKVYDFGLVRLVMHPSEAHWGSLFVNLGYVAPEYARTLAATPVGDVYSFGVVLLELVTGEKPTCVSKAPESFKGNLVEWISQLSTDSTLHDAIDRSLVGCGYDDEVFKLLQVSCRCVLSDHNERPTMFEVYQLLKDIGHRYDFTNEGDDDVLVLSDSGTSNPLEIVVDRKV